MALQFLALAEIRDPSGSDTESSGQRTICRLGKMVEGAKFPKTKASRQDVVGLAESVPIRVPFSVIIWIDGTYCLVISTSIYIEAALCYVLEFEYVNSTHTYHQLT